MLLVSGVTAFAQTSATNFTTNDCSGVSHTLFTELDSGKVIVLVWVMPCGACVNVAATVSSAVASYATSNPGKVKFYLVDDYANTTCNTLTGWATTNTISMDASFSNAAIDMSNYGTPGMQKTIVLAGKDHKVFYNQVGAVNGTSLKTSINNGIIATTVGIAEPIATFSATNLFPNPTANSATISYALQSSTDVVIDLFDISGNKIKNVLNAKQSGGEQKININCAELNNGFYFIKLSVGKTEKAIAFTVSH